MTAPERFEQDLPRLLAQSVMAELSHDRRLRPGSQQGRLDQFVWTLSVTRFHDGAPAPHASRSNKLASWWVARSCRSRTSCWRRP